MRFKYHGVVVFVGAVAIAAVLGAPALLAVADSLTQPLKPGDSLSVTCPTSFSSLAPVDANTFSLACATPVPTNTPVPPTATPMGSGTGVCGESNAMWHPPVINGCATGHEHGDAPPDWVATSNFMPMFDHPGNTPNENILKHSSFKGFSAQFNGQDIYVIMHLDTNPSGHASRFHSVQLWVRDAAGAVSHLDNWLDFGVGNNTGPQVERFGCDPDIRPIMHVNDRACSTSLFFEAWYANPAGYQGNAQWMADFGFNVSPNYYAGCDPNDRTTWAACETGGTNGTRRIELAWYANRSSQRGVFWATNFGQIVSGPSDPLCGTTKTVGTKTYPVECIQQYLAPTLGTIAFPGNAIQKQYDLTGVINPN